MKGAKVWDLPLVLAAALLAAGTGANAGERIKGFTDAGSKEQRRVEALLKGRLDPAVFERHLKVLTAQPHIAGTERDRELALYVRDAFRESGLEEVEIVGYRVLLSYPREILVEMVEPVAFKASLREEAYAVDKDTSSPLVSVGFNAYSASGEVTAPLVYAFGGNPEDYDRLLLMGIDIRGKIALVRYSEPYSYRGFKALTAQRRGAAGLLIYSDPEDDGAGRGPVFPDGPWGPESHIQRGGIPFDFMVPGDPLTPGWASVPGARRLKPEESEALPRIISVPLSSKDARPLLAHLAGPEAPPEWQGGLPLTYRVGPGPAKVHLKVDMDNPVAPIWNVVGRIEGREEPEKWVVIGNHRDAWVYGAVDPSSGTAALLGLARELGRLAREGFRPRRTIVFCSWDAEEYTLTGSTEWAEQHADKLKGDGVAYLNVDSAASGPRFTATVMPSLAGALRQVVAEVPDPATGKPIAEVMEPLQTRVGSGSDHTAFLNFIGMPVADLAFEGPYGVYHSQFDNFFWMSRFGDPGFRYHGAIAAIWGLMALRLANAPIVPFDYEAYAKETGSYVAELSGSYDASLAPAVDALKGRIEELRRSARELNSLIDGILDTKAEGPAASLRALNAALMKVERDLGTPGGIPGRPWYKHLVYACKYTYAAEVLPGVTEALEAGDRARTKEQVALLAQALARAARTLEEARAALSRTRTSGRGAPASAG